MIDRNSNLKAFQARCREACGGEFASIKTFCTAVGVSYSNRRQTFAKVSCIGRLCMVDDLAEAVFDLFHPKPKRCG